MDGFGYSMFLSRALMEDDAWFDLLYLRILAPDPVDLCGNSTFAQSHWTFDMYLFVLKLQIGLNQRRNHTFHRSSKLASNELQFYNGHEIKTMFVWLSSVFLGGLSWTSIMHTLRINMVHLKISQFIRKKSSSKPPIVETPLSMRSSWHINRMVKL